MGTWNEQILFKRWWKKLPVSNETFLVYLAMSKNVNQNYSDIPSQSNHNRYFLKENKNQSTNQTSKWYKHKPHTRRVQRKILYIVRRKLN